MEFNRSGTLRPIPVALVLSKWDLMPKDIDLKDFVEKHLTNTKKWLENYEYFSDTKVFQYSVGEVDVNAHKIKIFNPKDAQKITEWIYQTLTN